MDRRAVVFGAELQRLLAAAEADLGGLGGGDEHRLAGAHPLGGAFQLVADVVADGDFESLGARRLQLEVVDGDRLGAARAVRRDDGGRPIRRLGDGDALQAEVGRLAVDDQAGAFPAAYGATRVRTYFAIMS